MGGADMEESGRGICVARILLQATQHIRDGHLNAGVLLDINGNQVGRIVTNLEME